MNSLFITARKQLGLYFYPLIGFIAALGMIPITLVLPNKYTAVATILPGDASGKGQGALGQMAAAAAAVGIASPGQEGPDLSYIDVMNSRTIGKKVLLANYTFDQQEYVLGHWDHHEETLYAYLKVKSLDQGYRKLKSMITLARDIKTKLITVTVITRSPQLSCEIAGNIVHELDLFMATKNRNKGGAKAIFIATRLEKAQIDYGNAEKSCMLFASEHRNYFTSNDPLIRLEGQKLDHDLRVREQVVTTLTLSLEQALVDEKNDMPIVNVLDEPSVPADKSAPSRGLLILSIALLAGGGLWVWDNRVKLNLGRAPKEGAKDDQRPNHPQVEL